MRRPVGLLAVLAAVTTSCAGAAGPRQGGTAGPTETGPPVQLQGRVNDHGTVELAGGELELEADDFFFEPTFVRGDPGSTLSVEVENEGDASHTFTVDSLRIDQVLEPGDRKEIQLTLPSTGIVTFYCRLHLSQGMQGAFFFTGGETASEPGSRPGY